MILCGQLEVIIDGNPAGHHGVLIDGPSLDMIDGVILTIMDGMESITHIKDGRIGIITSTYLLIGDKTDQIQFTSMEEEAALFKTKLKIIEDV